ncbi:MAG TPA: hypothetical protein VF599_24165 [Pyrinomonadaceae bacterium]|jgi:hypothetical protein
MKRFFPSTLVIVGGILVVAPIIYKYLLYRLLTHILIERADLESFNFNSNLPKYYLPACLVIGTICIGLGIVFEIKDRSANKPL